ncbi:MAG: helix-turn-helix domain-containing protein [Aristaeellaceae bacterium]
MTDKLPQAALDVMSERFGKDSLIALATMDGARPSVRTVDALYVDGAFYVITHALSGKMRQIALNPAVAVSGEWFTGHGVGENLGHVCAAQNRAIAAKLRAAFAAWYDNGHTNEADPNTCILRIRLTDGVLFSHGTRYELDFGLRRDAAEDAMTIPEKIKQARKAAGLTQKQVGLACGYDDKNAERSARHWESGTRPVPIDKLRTLSQVLNIPLDQLIP